MQFDSIEPMASNYKLEVNPDVAGRLNAKKRIGNWRKLLHLSFDVSSPRTRSYNNSNTNSSQLKFRQDIAY